MVIDDAFSSRLVSGHEYLPDPENRLTVEQAQQNNHWRLAQEPILNFGLSEAPVWVRFDLKNPGDTPRRLLMEFAHPLLDEIDLTLVSSRASVRQISVGDEVLLSGRLLAHGNFLIPLELARGESLRVIARVQSSTTLQIPIRLWRYGDFIEANYVELTLYGMFFGLMLAIGLYHLLIYAALRESGWLYYALTNLSLLGVFLALRGVPAIFFPGSGWSVNDYFLAYSICGAVIFPCLFTRDVLIIRESRPLLARLLNSVAIAAVVSAILLPLIDYRVAVIPLLALATISLLANGGAHIIRFLDGYPPAKYVLVAGIFTILGLVVAVLEKTGWLPSNELTIGASYVGVSIMTMLYAFALAYRMNMDRELRLTAQEEAFEAQQTLIESQRKLNAELDQRVHERTEELQRLNLRLQRLSSTDALTQLRNRHYFDEVFSRELSRAHRENMPIGILLLDLDHFKKLNDTYGHQFGDACLQQVGERIREVVQRPADVAARYGGEEFIVLLINTDLDGARTVAEKIHGAFQKKPVTFDGQTAALTVSIGVVSVIPDDSNSYETIIKAADDLLYQAKAGGRNQVIARALDG